MRISLLNLINTRLFFLKEWKKKPYCSNVQQYHMVGVPVLGLYEYSRRAMTLYGTSVSIVIIFISIHNLLVSKNCSDSRLISIQSWESKINGHNSVMTHRIRWQQSGAVTTVCVSVRTRNVWGGGVEGWGKLKIKKSSYLQLTTKYLLYEPWFVIKSRFNALLCRCDVYFDLKVGIVWAKT